MSGAGRGQDLQMFGVLSQQPEQVAHRFGDPRLAAFIFLESPGAAPQNQPGLTLRKMQDLLANFRDFTRRQKIFGLGAEIENGGFRLLDIGNGQDHLVAGGAIKARLLNGQGLALESDFLRSGIPVHLRPAIGAFFGFSHGLIPFLEAENFEVGHDTAGKLDMEPFAVFGVFVVNILPLGVVAIAGHGFVKILWDQRCQDFHDVSHVEAQRLIAAFRHLSECDLFGGGFGLEFFQIVVGFVLFNGFIMAPLRCHCKENRHRKGVIWGDGYLMVSFILKNPICRIQRTIP